MDLPCETRCSDAITAVRGFGDPNADFHLIGDAPAVHGGRDSGIPFTGPDGRPVLLEILSAVGLLEKPTATEPVSRNLFMSYLYPCCSGGSVPSTAQYAQLEPFFDAELRAVAAHVLMPVGERAIRHVFREFSAIAPETIDDPATLHAEERPGSGFLLLPIGEPDSWTDRDRTRLSEQLDRILSSDYRQMSDLSRFAGADDLYLVR